MNVALITGANKGIGFETARLLGRRRMKVWLGARDVERGKEAEEKLAGEGIDGRFVHMDVTDPHSVVVAMEAIAAEDRRLDVLVNNAGIVGDDGWSAPTEVTTESIRRVLETNVFGAVTVTNAALPLLLRSSAGRIVNLSSPLGSLAIAAAGSNPAVDSQVRLLAYSSSKAALNMVTLIYARHLDGTPIKVNAVNPGYCATDMNAFQGILSAAEGAAQVAMAATLPEDGPSGTFLGADPLTW